MHSYYKRFLTTYLSLCRVLQRKLYYCSAEPTLIFTPPMRTDTGGQQLPFLGMNITKTCTKLSETSACKTLEFFSTRRHSDQLYEIDLVRLWSKKLTDSSAWKSFVDECENWKLTFTHPHYPD